MSAPLDEVRCHADPFRQFASWYQEARAAEADPTAMALATASPDGRPSVRTVLLKGVDKRGFVFYTNYGSRKARELEGTALASLLFLWRALDRQVRIEGAVERVSAEESDAYFASRPVESRWSVYASRQSAPVPDRAALEAQFEAARRTYGDQVPRPAWWGGYRVIPDRFEFWQGRPSRLHDRVEYLKTAGDAWTRRRLAP